MAQSEFLTVALAAVSEACQLVRSRYGDPALIASTKPDGSVVTEIDTQTETFLRQKLRAAFPDHAIMGEEQGMEGESEYCWWLDPIDGSRMLKHGIPFFATFITLTLRGEPIVGVIAVPMMGNDGWLLWAEKGQGAWLNGKPVRVSGVDQLSKAVIDHGGLKHFAEKNLAPNLVELAKKVASCTCVTTALAQIFVANGSLEATLENGSAWDFMAAAMIITEAGGRVTDLQGKPIDAHSRTMLASNGRIHDQVLEIFSQRT